MTSIWRWFGTYSVSGADKLALALILGVARARKLPFPRLWAAVLVVLGWPLTVSAAPAWRVLEMPRFTVVSQISERETRAWAEEFNQFTDALQGVLPVDERLLPRLTVIFFAREKDFNLYRPVGENGKVQDWVTGYFSRQETWSVAAMSDRFEDESMRRSMYQDGVYWFVSADQRRYPVWFEAGLASLFSMFSLQDHKVQWGQPIEAHVRSLNRQKLMPLQKLLSVSLSDKLFNDEVRVSLFYAESWAFVHYLMFGQRKGSQGSLNDFMKATYGGLSDADALKKVFGMDFAAMESALDTYLSDGKYRVYMRPASPPAKITVPFEPASPALVQVALAKLAYGSNHRDMAKKHAEEAVRLDPSYAAGYTMLAWVRRNDESADGFFEAADKAAQLGAQDADALWLLAMAKAKKARALGGVPSVEARQIANLLERAINLFPAQKSAYLNLGSILSQVDQPKEQDTLFLEQGWKMFPDEPMLLLGQAQLLRKKGNKPEALKLLQALLDQPGQISVQQREQVEKQKISWDVADTLEQLKELISQKQYKEAVVLLDALLARGTTVESRPIVIQARRDMCAFATIHEANIARKGGQKEEAARLYQSILDMERIPAQVRGQAQQALQKLNNRPAASIPTE